MLKMGYDEEEEHYLLYPSSWDVVDGVYERKEEAHASNDCHDYRIESLPKAPR